MEKNNEKVKNTTAKKGSVNKTKKTQGIDRNKLFLILIVAVIVICIIVIACLSNKDENQNNVNNNNQSNNTGNNNVINDENANAVFENIIDMNVTENVKVENNVKINTSAKLAEERVYEGMKIKDIKLTSDGNTGVTGFTATVENTSGKNFAGGSIIIKFLNKDGGEMATLEGYIDAVAANATTEILSFTGADLANAYDFKIEKK